MADPSLHPTFPALLQRFFVDHLRHQRAVSPCTVAAYRDTFRLLLGFAQATTGKMPTDLTLGDLDASLILGFLDHLERDRGNSVRSRNARLSAIRSFLKYAAHQDLSSLAIIDLSMKEEALGRLQPLTSAPARYRPPDQLMAFLQSM